MKEVWIPSPHYSSSRGPYNKIVFHTTEGAMTIESLGSWFQNPGAQCSSHHGADQYKAGTLGAYVYENHKAWTQGNANPYCLSLEMCAYASWSRSTWLGKPVLIDNAAMWLRYCVDKYNVPWTVLNDSQAQNPDIRGICQHVNFGSWGSGHHDAGSGFPMDEVIKRAKAGSGSGSGGGTTPQQEETMAAAAFDSQNRMHLAAVWEDGKVNYRPPGGSWYAVDPTQSGAKRGSATIAISGDDKITIPYINGAAAFCSYDKPVDGGEFAWVRRSPDSSF